MDFFDWVSAGRASLKIWHTETQIFPVNFLMRIAVTSPDLLVIKHMPWLPVIFSALLAIFAAVLMGFELKQPEPEWFGVVIGFAVPLLILSFCSFSRITASRTTRTIEMTHWRLFSKTVRQQISFDQVTKITLFQGAGKTQGGWKQGERLCIYTHDHTYPMLLDDMIVTSQQKQLVVGSTLKHFIDGTQAAS